MVVAVAAVAVAVAVVAVVVISGGSLWSVGAHRGDEVMVPSCLAIYPLLTHVPACLYQTLLCACWRT